MALETGADRRPRRCCEAVMTLTRERARNQNLTLTIALPARYRRDRGRRAAAEAGAVQPDLERDQVHPGGRHDQASRRSARTAATCMLAVADTGVGIPAADQERVFEKFERGNPQAPRIRRRARPVAGQEPDRAAWRQRRDRIRTRPRHDDHSAACRPAIVAAGAERPACGELTSRPGMPFVVEYSKCSASPGWTSGIGRVRRERRLGEAGQDQLQLAGIGGDVADGEDAGLAGRAGRRIDRDVVALQRQAPVGDRAQSSSPGRRTAAAHRPRAAASRRRASRR